MSDDQSDQLVVFHRNWVAPQHIPDPDPRTTDEVRQDLYLMAQAQTLRVARDGDVSEEAIRARGWLEGAHLAMSLLVDIAVANQLEADADRLAADYSG